MPYVDQSRAEEYDSSKSKCVKWLQRMMGINVSHLKPGKYVHTWRVCDLQMNVVGRTIPCFIWETYEELKNGSKPAIGIG